MHSWVVARYMGKFFSSNLSWEPLKSCQLVKKKIVKVLVRSDNIKTCLICSKLLNIDALSQKIASFCVKI